MHVTPDVRKATGYVFIGLSAIFVFWTATTHCFATNYWFMEPDPTYAYLLNGLNIATLQSVGHTDHPGTVLQILCAILLRLFYFFSPDAGSHSIVQSVLANPEWYLKNLYISIFVLQSAILAIVAAWVWSSFNNIPMLVVILGGLFVIPELIPMQASALRPEILIPSLLLLLTLVTLKRWREDTLSPVTPSRHLALGTGALTGLAFFTKATCFPIFCVTFFFWKDWKSKRYYLAGFASIALMCLPFIWSSLGPTIKWFALLALRDGHYGSGSTSILSPSLFYTNMITIVSSNTVTVALLVLTFIGLFVFRNERHSFFWKISTLFLLSIPTIILLAAKHYSSHYLIAIYIPTYFILFLYLSQSKKLNIVAVSCILYLLIIAASYNKLYSRMSSDSDAFSGKNFYYEDKYFKEKNIVELYNTFTITYALGFGNKFSKNKHAKILRSMYPNVFMYCIWSKRFHHFGRHVSLEEILLSKRTAIIRGTNLKSHADGYGEELILGREILSPPEKDVVYELLGIKDK